MKKSLAKNSIYNIIYTVANIIFPFITSIYVSRILLPIGTGKVASAQNIATYFVTLAALGLPTYGVREFAKVREDKIESNKLFTELLILNLVSTTIAITLYFVLVFINNGFNGEWSLYAACGLTIFFNYLNIDWMYKGLEEYGYITARSLLVKGLSLFALFLFVKTRKDYPVYALITSLATGGNYIFNVINARKYVKLDFSNIKVSKHLKPVLLIACIIFLSSIYNNIDVTMLNVMANDESVGFYWYAQKTVNMVLAMASAVTAALLPRLSYYYENDKEEFYHLLDKGFQILCIMTLPLSVGLGLIAPQVVNLLYGEAFSPASLTIRLMCPLILIKGFGDLFCYQLVYSTKNEKIIIPAAASASIINIIVNAILIPTFFQNGAVIASVFSELITNGIQFTYMIKRIKFGINKKVLFTGLLSTTFMSIMVIILMQVNLPNMLAIIVEILGGVIVYVIVNIIMKNSLLFEILNKINIRLKHSN